MNISFKTFVVLILEQILKPIVSKNDFIQLVKNMFNSEKAFFNISYIRNNKPTIHCEKIKDILRYCYLNNILHLDKTEKIRFQKFLLKDDYIRINNQTDIKKLIVFLSNNGFYLPNFFKFNTKNTFSIYNSSDLYKLNKKSNDFKIYVFNVFDYYTNNGKSDTNQTIILYLTKNLYKLYNEWLQQKNIIQINDLNNHYLNNNDKKLLKQLKSKKTYINNINKDIDLYTEKINDIYYHSNVYNHSIKIDWEKEQLETNYNHNLTYDYKEGLNDLELQNRPIKDCFKAIEGQINCNMVNNGLLVIEKEYKQQINNELHSFLIISEKRHKKQIIDNLEKEKIELKKQLLSSKIDNPTYYEKVKKINKDIRFYL